MMLNGLVAAMYYYVVNIIYVDYAVIPYCGWSINIYILNQPKFSKRGNSPLMEFVSNHVFSMESLQADSWIFLFVISSLDLMAVLSPTSCLTTAFTKNLTRVRLVLFF